MLIYLFGEPGVGKSTLTNQLLTHLTQGQPTHHTKPFHHTTWPNNITHLGNPHPKNPKHPGTDTLGYNVMPQAITWITQTPTNHTIIGEGDRLASTKLWNAAGAAGHNIIPIYLHNPHHAHHQRQTRQTTQNPTWIRGRQTRNLNLTTYPGTIICDPHNPTTLTDLLTIINGEQQ